MEITTTIAQFDDDVNKALWDSNNGQALALVRHYESALNEFKLALAVIGVK